MQTSWLELASETKDRFYLRVPFLNEKAFSKSNQWGKNHCKI